MTPTVHLHIGEPKSGTTYLQSMLAANRDALEEAGLRIPGQREQVRAAQEAIRGKGESRLWNDMATSLLTWQGSVALISMETLCRAKRPAIKRAVEAFGEAEIRVHITVRDLLRSLPAQWQQSTQHRKTWSWPEYCNAVVDNNPSHPAGANFWSQHDLEEIVSRWSAQVGPERLYVTTVPHPSADPALLWQRFSQAVGIELSDPATASASNESLGATSAELLRRLNIELEPLGLNEKQYNVAVRGILSRQILAARRGREPKVQLPESAQPWAERESERLIAAVLAAGVHIIGDLDDLRPQPGTLVSHAETSTDGQLVETALEALSGLVQHLAQGR